MATQTVHSPGRLVRFRDREWMVLPSEDPDLLVLKPLGGADEEITAVFLPLEMPEEHVEEARFELPSPDDIGAYATAKMLFDASRLSFRNASGPFRCMGKLSFRPRAYQLVPLVMALKQDFVRLMVADDVGIGKTIEALTILKELMERGDVKKFAVICPPHLCEQWQQELKDKLDIEAEIIRSSTAASLDRRLPDDRSVFYHVPYQVISIDYIKADKRRGIFLGDCPEFIIVDEAHTCALPEGAKSKTQQQRHSLVYDIAQKNEQHLLLLTATPHSGKDSEFLSLLGLLNPEFRTYEFAQIDQNKRRKIAKHFIQRKRENIRRWMKEVTPFPDRDSKEIGYSLSMEYKLFYEELLKFARGISSKEAEKDQAKHIRYWAALALLRGVMSSPAAGLEMLQNRQAKQLLEDDDYTQIYHKNPLFENLDNDTDVNQVDLVGNANLQENELAELTMLSKSAEKLFGLEQDWKAKAAVNIITSWVKAGYHPIIFCKYIATAKYLGEILQGALPKKIDVQVITSELADEQRKEKIQLMGESEQRVLVATDCLSEGINLQEFFTAVLHYDLPWNPNRIEQREGRVDRFGQTAEEVKAYLLWGEDNPIDQIVLQVLIRKVRDIQKATGVSISIGEDNQSIIDAVLHEVLLEKKEVQGQQMRLFAEEQITNELELARQKAENLRSIFAHETIKPEAIEADLKEIDEVIGDVDTVEGFVHQAVTHLGATLEPDGAGFILMPHNLPPHLKSHFSDKNKVKISFDSPTPKGYRYIGRNHQFVEQLCQFMLALAFNENKRYQPLARVSEIQTDLVNAKTTLVMFRVRNVIKEVKSKREIIAEEMYLWGYQGVGDQVSTLEYAEAKELLQKAVSVRDFSFERQAEDLNRELQHFDQMQHKFMELATQRAEHLVEAHGRFKELVGGRRYEKATPVLPPDVMGVYILMPQPKLSL